MAITFLTDLHPNEGGIILKVGGSGRIRHRFLEMGLTEGAALQVLRFAPLGDPIEVCIRDYCLSLRKDEARQILLATPPSIPLTSTITDREYKISQILGGEGVHMALREKDLQIGTVFRRIHHPSRAIMLSHNGSISTLGYGIARKIIVEEHH